MPETPSPPPGFELDAQGPPPPPEGFVVDTKQPRTGAPPQASAVSRFAKGLYDSTIGGVVQTVKQELEPGEMIEKGANERDPKKIAKGMMYSALGPGAPLIKGLLQSQAEEGSKAAKSKSLAGKMLHGAAAAVPVAGPIAANLTEQVQSGDTAGALGSAAGIALPMLLGKVVPSRIPPIARIKLSPIEEAAMTEAKSRGIPISAGQKTGSKLLQNTEQMMQHVPGSAGRAQRFFDTQKEAGAAAFRKIPSEVTAYKSQSIPPGVPIKERLQKNPQISAMSTDATGAGQAVMDRVVSERMSALKQNASRDYDSIQKQLDYHRDNIQPKEFARAKEKYQRDLKEYMDSKNSKDPPTFPEKPASAAPVDMAPIRANLKPLYEELTHTLPETQRQSSPGYQALRNIVEGKEVSKDALTVDKDLSAVKGILRKGRDGYLNTPSARYANRSVAAMESQIEKSLNDINPNLLYRLKRARSAVKEYHNNNELISKLAPPGRSPIEAFNRLTASGGNQLPEITELKRIAPNALKAVGKTYLQGLVETATSEGGLSRTASILNKWKALDPRVKREIFGHETVSGLDRFFLAAKKLNLDLNPSGTAKWLAMSRTIGETTAALTALLTGHPAALAAFGGTVLGMNKLSKVMFTPGGVKLLTEAVSLPIGTRLQLKALSGIEALAESEDSVNKERAETQAPPPSSKPVNDSKN